MVRITEANDGTYVIRMPKETTKGLDVKTYNQIKKMSFAQMQAWTAAFYAAAVYEKRDTTDIEMDWDEEVMPAIQSILGLTDEAADELRIRVQEELSTV